MTQQPPIEQPGVQPIADGQLELPFAVPATPRRARAGRLGAVAHRVRGLLPDHLRPEHLVPARVRTALGWVSWTLALLARGIVRWALRLALPLLSVAVVLRSFPYTAKVEGVSFLVQGTILHRPGLSADTTVGNWEFPSVDGLPIGAHVTPQNVDILSLAQAAHSNAAAFADRLQTGMKQQLPHVAVWLATETVIGLLLGLAASAVVNMAAGYLLGRIRRPDELLHRARQLLAALVVVVVASAYGVLSYNPHWLRQSRLTGTLAAAQLFPDQLTKYYQKSKAQDVLGSVVGIQGALQATIEQNATPDTALRIMEISDVHLAAIYPLVAQYAKNYNVNLILNTGDESEFGTRAEMTPAFVQSIAALTKTTPMLWLAGNHDSPDVVKVMAAIPGVTVLGEKDADPGGFTVSAGAVQAFGLRIAGLPDPRVYAAAGSFGADDANVTDPLERAAVDRAMAGVAAQKSTFDIFATHEPVAALELRKQLPGQIRQTDSGHLHAQNATGDIQTTAGIDLVEGSTGAGGLDNIVRGAAQPPIEFSIESVAPDCQFTRVLRFQIRSPQIVDETSARSYGDDVTVSTDYFRPQAVAAGRTCGPELGVGPEIPLP